MTDSVIYDVYGMTCAGCARALLVALKDVGADVALVDISASAGTLSVSDGTPESTVLTAAASAGFRALRRKAE